MLSHFNTPAINDYYQTTGGKNVEFSGLYISELTKISDVLVDEKLLGTNIAVTLSTH